MQVPPIAPIRGRAHVLVALLGLALVGDLVLLVDEVVLYRLASRVEAGGYVSIDEAQGWVGLSGIMANVGLGMLLVTIVTWLVWQHRAQSNLDPIGAAHDFSPGMAVGWWFIPFANLVQPYRAMRELWTESAHRLDAPRGSAIVGWWWASWLGGGFVGGILGGMAEDVTTVGDAKRVFLTGIVTTWLGIVAAVLAIMIVRGVVARQTAPRPLPEPGPLPVRPDV